MSARLKSRRFILLAHGTGPRLAGEAADVAKSRAPFDALVSVGFCGALRADLEPGDVFLATGLATEEPAETAEIRIPDKHPDCRVGTLLSVDRVVDTVREKEELHRLGADAVEMEAAGLAARAAHWGIPLYCIRAVTDTAQEGFSCDLNQARDANGRIRVWPIVLRALHRPVRRMPELVRLARRGRLAAGKLGAFLADCHY